MEVVESHISRVFLAGDRAYKLRKPVVCPFLPYGTADRRRAMCEEEVRLGRRLAPDLYRRVRPLVQTADGWALGAPVEAGAEHVVEMRRFDPGRTLARSHAGWRGGPGDGSRRTVLCGEPGLQPRATVYEAVPNGVEARLAGGGHQLLRGRRRRESHERTTASLRRGATSRCSTLR